jgi:hypothetical protein
MTEQGKVKTKRPGKEAIIAFRLEKDDGRRLDEVREGLSITSVKSRGHMCRKIVKDFLMGRLIYVTPQHQLLDPARNHSSHQDPLELA